MEHTNTVIQCFKYRIIRDDFLCIEVELQCNQDILYNIYIINNNYIIVYIRDIVVSPDVSHNTNGGNVNGGTEITQFNDHFKQTYTFYRTKCDSINYCHFLDKISINYCLSEISFIVNFCVLSGLPQTRSTQKIILKCSQIENHQIAYVLTSWVFVVNYFFVCKPVPGKKSYTPVPFL